VLLYTQHAGITGFADLLYLFHEKKNKKAHFLMRLGASDIDGLQDSFPHRRLPESMACYYTHQMARLFDLLHAPHPVDGSFLVLYDAVLNNFVIDAITGTHHTIDPGIAHSSAEATQIHAVGMFR